MTNVLNVNIKKLADTAILPSYSKVGDAGMDLTATSKEYDEDGNVCYGTGLAFEIPEGFVGLLFPRSSLSKKDLSLANHVGVIDSGFRGEVSFKFKPTQYYDKEQGQCFNPEDYCHNQYDIGDRVGQIIILPYPQINFIEVSALSSTERGEGGYGSTGK